MEILLLGFSARRRRDSLFERFPRETGGRTNLIIYMEDGFSRGLRENLDGRMSIRRIFIRRIFIRHVFIRRMSIRRIFIRRMLIRRISYVERLFPNHD